MTATETLRPGLDDEAPTLAALVRDVTANGDRARLAELSWTDAVDLDDLLITLLDLYDLWMAPLPELGRRIELQSHPTLLQLKNDLEIPVRARLDALVDEEDATGPELPDGESAAAAMRRIAAADLVPPVYEWLAEEATWDELVRFLAEEGGPDAGFDDLVAICQVGLRGVPKLALGENYWDEMGRGEYDGIHTVLHDEMVRAIDMPRIAREDLPREALERMVLGGFLATNRALQPELVGALGMIELQAGPRCRKVMRALQRLDAPPEAIRFYEEHAQADPIHGRDWLDRAVEPLEAAVPDWGPRMVRGARWRSIVNRRFFAEVETAFVDGVRSPG
jgi:hypothetical protein